MDEGLESCLVEIGLEMEGARGYDGWLVIGSFMSPPAAPAFDGRGTVR